MPETQDLLASFFPQQPQTFSTHSISTAAALMAVGIPLLRVEGDRAYAGTFVLRNNNGEATLAEADHIAGWLMVSTRDYQAANNHARNALMKFKADLQRGQA